MTTSNIAPDGIHLGVVSMHQLHPDVVEALCDVTDWDGDEGIDATYEGILVRPFELGGCLHFFILDSPYVQEYKPCSPCAPGGHDVQVTGITSRVEIVADAPDRTWAYAIHADWYAPDDATTTKLASLAQMLCGDGVVDGQVNNTYQAHARTPADACAAILSVMPWLAQGGDKKAAIKEIERRMPGKPWLKRDLLPRGDRMTAQESIAKAVRMWTWMADQYRAGGAPQKSGYYAASGERRDLRACPLCEFAGEDGDGDGDERSIDCTKCPAYGRWVVGDNKSKCGNAGSPYYDWIHAFGAPRLVATATNMVNFLNTMEKSNEP